MIAKKDQIINVGGLGKGKLLNLFENNILSNEKLVIKFV